MLQVIHPRKKKYCLELNAKKLFGFGINFVLFVQEYFCLCIMKKIKLIECCNLKAQGILPDHPDVRNYSHDGRLSRTDAPFYFTKSNKTCTTITIAQQLTITATKHKN